MKKRKTAMYIGKFNPAHQGHILVILWLLLVAGYDRVVIVLGSRFEMGYQKQPFLATYREKMLLFSLKFAGVDLDRVIVVHLEDFADNKVRSGWWAWWKHVVAIGRRYNVTTMVTGNEEMVLSEIKQREIVVPFERIFNPEKELPIEFQFPFHATDMRQCIEVGDWVGFKKMAACGTLALMGAVNGAEGICESLKNNQNLFVPGRQTVDMIIVNRYQGENYIVCGYRSNYKKNFPGRLAIPGGAIKRYLNPEVTAICEVKKKTGLEIVRLERYLEPTPISVNGVLSQMRSLGLFSSRDELLAGNQGGSS